MTAADSGCEKRSIVLIGLRGCGKSTVGRELVKLIGVLNARNVETLRAVGTLVWLTASPDVLWQRISADPATVATRPALTGLTGLDEVEQTLAERAPHYEAAADLVMDTTRLNPREIAAEIARRVDAATKG